jgi:hypothetical protein
MVRAHGIVDFYTKPRSIAALPQAGIRGMISELHLGQHPACRGSRRGFLLEDFEYMRQRPGFPVGIHMGTGMGKTDNTMLILISRCSEKAEIKLQFMVQSSRVSSMPPLFISSAILAISRPILIPYMVQTSPALKRYASDDAMPLCYSINQAFNANAAENSSITMSMMRT